jgi:hypothetical protein
MKTLYVIQTPTGFVGHYTITDPYNAEMPRVLAASFDSIDAAEHFLSGQADHIRETGEVVIY